MLCLHIIPLPGLASWRQADANSRPWQGRRQAQLCIDGWLRMCILAGLRGL
jgi:hypothetical protein